MEINAAKKRSDSCRTKRFLCYYFNWLCNASSFIKISQQTANSIRQKSVVLLDIGPNMFFFYAVEPSETNTTLSHAYNGFDNEFVC